jgi:hypothetical protein
MPAKRKRGDNEKSIPILLFQTSGDIIYNNEDY